jgi:hypothetical protein
MRSSFYFAALFVQEGGFDPATTSGASDHQGSEFADRIFEIARQLFPRRSSASPVLSRGIEQASDTKHDERKGDYDDNEENLLVQKRWVF